jgi:hypothetical protein
MTTPEDPVPGMPPAGTSTPVRLGADHLGHLRATIEQQAPRFAPRLTGPLLAFEICQPFFARHRVLQVQSPSPFPATAIHCVWDGAAMAVLTGRLDHLVAVAEADPPSGLTDAGTARVYGNLVDAWTSGNWLGDLQVGSFAEIPWKSPLTDEERDRVEDLRARFETDIQPPVLVRGPASGYVLSRWIVADRHLIARRLHLPADGQVRREDDVRAEDLPVHPGRVWGMVDGRLIPIG